MIIFVNYESLFCRISWQWALYCSGEAPTSTRCTVVQACMHGVVCNECLPLPPLDQNLLPKWSRLVKLATINTSCGACYPGIKYIQNAIYISLNNCLFIIFIYSDRWQANKRWEALFARTVLVTSQIFGSMVGIRKITAHYRLANGRKLFPK